MSGGPGYGQDRVTAISPLAMNLPQDGQILSFPLERLAYVFLVSGRSMMVSMPIFFIADLVLMGIFSSTDAHRLVSSTNVSAMSSLIPTSTFDGAQGISYCLALKDLTV